MCEASQKELGVMLFKRNTIMLHGLLLRLSLKMKAIGRLLLDYCIPCGRILQVGFHFWLL